MKKVKPILLIIMLFQTAFFTQESTTFYEIEKQNSKK
jgi:hypothetical protein